MAKKIEGYINLQVPAGKANPSPPIGPALGQRGVATSWSSASSSMPRPRTWKRARPIPVKITVYSDRSFTFEMRTPPASHLLKKAAKINGGSKEPGRASAGTITMAQVRDIAKVKMKDMNTEDLEAAARTLAGSARSMGLQVTE